MWILYVLLYLLGIFVTVFVTSYFNANFNDPMYVFMALLWPLTVAVLIPVALGFIAYDAGQWYKHKKDTMSFIEYMKTESFFGR